MGTLENGDFFLAKNWILIEQNRKYIYYVKLRMDPNVMPRKLFMSCGHFKRILLSDKRSIAESYLTIKRFRFCWKCHRRFSPRTVEGGLMAATSYVQFTDSWNWDPPTCAGRTRGNHPCSPWFQHESAAKSNRSEDATNMSGWVCQCDRGFFAASNGCLCELHLETHIVTSHLEGEQWLTEN